MDIEREIKVRDAIKYCIENFDSKTATNRIVEFWKDELKLQEQAINYRRCCKSDSELLFAFLEWLDYGLKEYKKYIKNEIEWISCRKEIPLNRRVLAHLEMRNFKTTIIAGYSEENGWMSNGEKFTKSQITHWAELPKLNKP